MEIHFKFELDREGQIRVMSRLSDRTSHWDHLVTSPTLQEAVAACSAEMLYQDTELGPVYCPHCSEPYTPHRKWNGGDPQVFWFSECTCDDEEFEKELNRRFGTPS